jgi:predicted nucleic acid-binding protein
MKIQKVYIDTSVIGGCFDVEFSKWSIGLFNDIRKGLWAPAVSEVVSAEVSFAPKEVREKFNELLSYNPQVLAVDSSVEMLVDAYIGHRILPEQFRNDMLHIALASAHEVDILVSWNFKHIVHFEKIVKFNAVNLEYGFRQLMIFSPREVVSDEAC